MTARGTADDDPPGAARPGDLVFEPPQTDDPPGDLVHEAARRGGPDDVARPTGRPNRDALTWAAYGTLSTWAWFLYGFGAILPLLRAEQGASRTVMGLHSLALAAGAAVAGVLVVPMVRRVRRRGSLLLGGLLASVGVVALVSTTPPPLTLTATLVTGIGGALLVNVSVATLVVHHGPAGPAALSEGNAAAAGVGLVAPLAIGAAVGLGWTWRPAAVVVLPLVALLVLAINRVPRGTAALDAVLAPRGQVRTPMPTTFWILLGLLMACVGIEFCCTAWSADLLRQQTGMSPGLASVGVTAVVGGMAVGRVVIGRLAVHHRPARLLVAALALTVAGWVLTWISVAPGVALAGLVVVGLGIAGHYPLSVSMVLGSVPGQADRATGVISLGIAVASGAAPFALGAVADATSTHIAFVAVPLLVGLAATALFLSGHARP